MQPISGGIVLLVGIKASNLDDEIRDHPRVVLWDSQQEHWTNKEIPANTRAVFCTRFVGHNVFSNIMSQVRKRHLTMFRPEGTGQIVKQVRELLDIPKMTEVSKDQFVEQTEPKVEETTMSTKGQSRDKLKPLFQFIDPNKTYADNARFLLVKAQEMGITTTFGSLNNSIATFLRKTQPKIVTPKVVKTKSELDVAVTMLDGVIKELSDMRDYLVKTTEENRTLKARIERFKKLIEGE